VCVERVRKLLGIIGGVKFYELPSLTKVQCERAMDTFFEASPAEQHAYFERLRAGGV
jgi:purine nucleoside phosphorylase